MPFMTNELSTDHLGSLSLVFILQCICLTIVLAQRIRTFAKESCMVSLYNSIG